MHEKIDNISKETGVSTKKILDFLFLLSLGNPIGNNELLQKVGVSRNALNKVKELLSFLLDSPSKTTQLNRDAIQQIKPLFGPDYKPEESLWDIFEDTYYKEAVGLLDTYANRRPLPDRKYDQFTATVETTARRVSLLNFFEDIRSKRLLFLGDDDFTSVASANLKVARNITVLDIDRRILDTIENISSNLKLGIRDVTHDLRKPLPNSLTDQFDIVFTDPPYTPEGIELFVSRAIEALDKQNKAARIYVCYGNSDRAKEKFLPIQEIFNNSGLMIRQIFDKFNRYQGAESIGSASSLFICEITPKTKSLIKGNYGKEIYTND